MNEGVNMTTQIMPLIIIIIMSLFRTKQVQQTVFTCVTHTILYKIVKQSQIEWH